MWVRAIRAPAGADRGCVSWSFGTVVGMDQTTLSLLARDAVGKLERYAYARDRLTDREPRTITLTDDEALALLWDMAGRPLDRLPIP